ncbi:Short-chain dehydrogenase/reductase SDR [Sesbania bispinosa]|nr:Short-chain dehydrogenase/reductase SDR [Sesbania bispinosa]
MASSGEHYNFPPQKQDTQPGKEYLMHPRPQFSSPQYNPSNKLQGKIAIVTGGDSGIGRAVCNLFALEGATVIFTYVKGQEDKDASDTLQIIKSAKTADAKDPMAIPTDLGFDENCKRVVDEVFRTNIFSHFFMTRHALKHMKEGSSIINTTSVNAYQGHPTLLDYTTTKGAIVAFTRALSLQLVSKGIRVNGVCTWTYMDSINTSLFNGGRNC